MLNYLNKNKNQNVEDFLRFGAFYAFKNCDNPIFNEDIDSIISHSSKNDDDIDLLDADIKSPDFWQKLINIEFNRNIFFNPENDTFQ